jgi:hypothetical protein
VTDANATAAPPPRWPWLNDILYPLAVAGMLGCIALVAVGWWRVYKLPSWNGFYIVVAAVLFALEAAFSERSSRARAATDGEHASGRSRFARGYWLFVEFLFLAIALRLVRYIGHPPSEIIQDLAQWPGVLFQLFDFEYILGLIITFTAWFISYRTMLELSKINNRLLMYRLDMTPLARLTRRFYVGAIALVFATAAFRPLPDPLREKTYSLRVFLITVVIYVVLGLLVVAHVRMGDLIRQWEGQRTDVPQSFAGQWFRATLLLIGAALLIMLFLPTGQSIPILRLTAGPQGELMPLPEGSWFSPLPPTPPAQEALEEAQSENPPAIIPGSQPAQPRPTSLLMTILFWGVLIIFAAVIAREYLADRPELLEALRSIRILKTLRLWWAAFVSWWARLRGALRERLPMPALNAPDASHLAVPGWLRLGTLSPREQVRTYYLGVLSRATSRGLGRKRTQTPYEYADTIARQSPVVHSDMDALTDLFVEARYSEAEIDPADAERAREASRRIRAEMRPISTSKNGSRT